MILLLLALTQAQADGMYAIAYGHMGFIPEKPPVVRVVNRKVICQKARLPDACPARGLTDADGTS